jgi:DNA-binding FadR family transcriptional regulator
MARYSFYDTLFQIAGNRELERMMADLQTHLIRVQFGTINRSVQPEARIADAVLSGRPSQARAIARALLGDAIADLRTLQGEPTARQA